MDNPTVTHTPITRLITIRASHYCEKARWALDWLKISYREEPHVPLFHRFATRKHGGRTVPLLVTETVNFVDSTDILHHLDSIATGDRKLYPTDPELRREVDELEELFDTQLGIHTRRWAYFYRINDRQVMRRSWCKGTPWFEQVGFAIAFPFMRRLVRRGLNITASTAASSLLQIKQIFEKVSSLLAGGRLYLVGDTFSAADLTFAALAAPALMPPEHPLKPPPLQEIATEMAKTIEELRATPAGTHALRLYREQRYRNQ